MDGEVFTQSTRVLRKIIRDLLKNKCPTLKVNNSILNESIFSYEELVSFLEKAGFELSRSKEFYQVTKIFLLFFFVLFRVLFPHFPDWQK